MKSRMVLLIALFLTGTFLFVDIAPTVLHLLGLKVPTHMDGKLLKEILNCDNI